MCRRSISVFLPNFEPIGQCCRYMAILDLSRWRTSAILDLWKFEFLTAATILRANVRHLAKFHADRSNRCQDIAIFRIFEMTAVRHLDGLRKFRPLIKSTVWSLSLCNIWLESVPLVSIMGRHWLTVYTALCTCVAIRNAVKKTTVWTE